MARPRSRSLRLPRISPRFYGVLTLVAMLSLTVIVVTGGAVRLTGSGLGCPDWPTCTATSVIPPSNVHGRIETANRVFTGVVGAAVILAVLGSLLRIPRRKDLLWLSIGEVVGVIAQAVLGGLSVLHRLDPRFVMGHFLLSMVLVWIAVVLWHRATQPDGPVRLVMHKDYLWLARAVVALVAVVLVVGTVVTGSGPHAGAADVHRFGFTPHDTAKVHASLVWMTVALTALTMWRLHVGQAPAKVLHRAELLMAALIAQGGVGYLQYFTGLPPALVVVHIAGATAAWMAAITFLLSFHERWERVDLAVYDDETSLPNITEETLHQP